MQQTPLLIIIRGLPGSGKTYLSNALSQHLPAATFITLDPDATNYESVAYKTHAEALAREGVDTQLHPYRFLRAQAYQAITDGKIIIWNQPFTNLEVFHKMLDGLKKYAAEHDTELDVLIVEVEIDPLAAKERVNTRKRAGGHGPSDSRFERFTNDYFSFADQGYASLIVYGKQDVQTSVDTILAALKQFGR